MRITKTQFQSYSYIINTIIIIYIISIIYYLGYIENGTCKCILTNQHYLVKKTCYIVLMLNLLLLFANNNIRYIVIPILNIYLLYSVYIYFNHLRNTKCTCKYYNFYLLHNNIVKIFLLILLISILLEFIIYYILFNLLIKFVS